MKDDAHEDRGPWMQTASGRPFYPGDPRIEEIYIADIANGLAMDCRYGGQIRIDRWYSVAEHCWLLADWASRNLPNEPLHLPLALLLHDGAEAYLNDLPRAVKAVVGEPYRRVEDDIQTLIFRKYGIEQYAVDYHPLMKSLDYRICQHEKRHLMRHSNLRWEVDCLEPLAGIRIRCWNPLTARSKWYQMYADLCGRLNMNVEELEI